MMPLYRKLNFLVSNTAPDYGDNGRMRTPYIRLTVGSWINRIPGVISSVNLKWQKDYPWELNMDGPEERGKQHMLVLPHVLDVTINYLPIHTFTPSNDFRNPFLGIEYWLSKNRQSAGSEALNHDFFLNMPTFNKIETKKEGPIENKTERPPLQKAILVDDSIGDAVSPTDPNTIG